MNYAKIKWADVANGPGIRISLFVSGCTHHCEGCFNPEAWDFQCGLPFTSAEEDSIIRSLSSPYLRGLSLLGGEPMEPDNQRALLPFLRRVREACPEKEIWCYSGYLLDRELWQPSRARCEVTDLVLRCLDVLVDGRFLSAEKDLSLRFRGSSNQRIIDVPKSLSAHTVILWDGAGTLDELP